MTTPDEDRIRQLELRLQETIDALEDREECHIVVIEWDGQKPPNYWYRRLRKMTGGVRSTGQKDYEQTPLERRFVYGKGIVVQEGAIYCQSATLAYNLAYIAREQVGAMMEERDGGRRPTVYVGKATISPQFNMSKQDIDALRRIEGHLKTPGKKPDAINYAITCLECAAVYNEEYPEDRVTVCPICGGTKYNQRAGSAYVYSDDGSDIIEFWQRTRFSGPHWEPAAITEDGPTAPALDTINIGGRQGNVFAAMSESDTFFDLVRLVAQDSRSTAIRILDTVLISRAHHPKEDRTEARIRALTNYTERGGDPVYMSFAETDFDLWDTALLLDPRSASGLVMQYQMGANAGRRQ